MMFAFARVPVFACLGFLAGVFCTVSAVGQTAQDYEAMQIEGWTVRVQDSLSDHPRRAQGLALRGDETGVSTDPADGRGSDCPT